MAEKVLEKVNGVKLIHDDADDTYSVSYIQKKGRYSGQEKVEDELTKEEAETRFYELTLEEEDKETDGAIVPTQPVKKNTKKSKAKKTMKKATKKSAKKTTATTKEVKQMKTNDVSTVKESLIEYAKSNLMKEIDSDIRSIFIPQKPTTRIDKIPLTNAATGEETFEEVKVEVPAKTKDEIKAEIISKFTTTLEGVIKLAEGFEKI